MENITPQKAFDLDPGAHGIRLDIYANDENSTRYAVEMQKDNDYNIPERSRYYISIMDHLTDAVTEDADPDLTAFYRYCKNSTAETAEDSGSDLVKQIHERVTALKNNSRLEVQFMKM